MAAIKQHKAFFVFHNTPQIRESAASIQSPEWDWISAGKRGYKFNCGPDLLHSCSPCSPSSASSGVQSGGSESLTPTAAAARERGGLNADRMVCSAACCFGLFGAAVLAGICNQIPFPVPQSEFAASFPGNEALN